VSEQKSAAWKYWHPVWRADRLSPGEVVSLVLLNERLVLWRDQEQGQFQAAVDRCPHRGAALSLGRVEAGQLRCAYLGWCFDRQGQCTSVPALAGFKPPSSYRLDCYKVRLEYGLIWIARGDATLPLFEAEHDSSRRHLLCGPYAVNASAPRIVENFLDMGHFAFVHEHLLGHREHCEVMDYFVGLDAHGLVIENALAWQPKASVNANEGTLVSYRYEVRAPFQAALYKSVTKDGIALFICPHEPESSTVWFRMALVDHESSDESLIAFQDRIFAQDLPILESQWPKCLPLEHGMELHCAADKASVAYRRYLRDQSICFGTV